jgi:hypothetical protein
VEHLRRPNPELSVDPDTGFHYLVYKHDLPQLRQALPRPSDPRPLSIGLSNTGSSNREPSNPGLPTEPEPHTDDQSLSADPEWDAAQAARYAAKGKAKQTRHISGTARDIGNVAQRELQPAERSPASDPGE